VFNPAPTSSDYSSDLYRVIENYDLKDTIKLNPLGLGFGKPFLQPLALPNILALDPYYQYIPHNTIYWVWMRLGVIGFIAFWYLFGSIVIKGCLIVRRLQDPYLQMVAIYIVTIVIMEIVVAYADYQLYFYRNIIYVGLLIGVLLKLPILDEKSILQREKEVSHL
jgi:O-antigen ligase